MTTHITGLEMASLLDDQSQLLQFLLANSNAPVPECLHTSGSRAALARRGLQAYRANAAALAQRALGAAYPVIALWMGDENFSSLARYFWQQTPPQRGDVAQWGAALPDFLDNAPQLASEPFLGDVGRIEWALHSAATAPDSALDAASFALLAGDSQEQTSLSLSGGTCVLTSAYPVVSIVHAYSQTSTLTHHSTMPRGVGKAQRALVWRYGLKPSVRVASAAEYALIQALQAGLNLETALTLARTADQASENSAFDFSAWLAQAVHTGLVTGARVLQCAHNAANGAKSAQARTAGRYGELG